MAKNCMHEGWCSCPNDDPPKLNLIERVQEALHVADTPPSIEERARKLCMSLNPLHGGWEHNIVDDCWRCRKIAAELRAYGEQRAGEEREACRAEICEACAQGVALNELGEHIFKRIGYPCKAAAIRRRT